MKAIIRREILNYLKRPLFWIAIVVVIFGVFQQLNPYLNIHYITSEEELENEYPEAVREGEIFEGYIPVSTEEHREGVYGYYGRPLAIMVRFPGMFFDVTPPPLAMVNQICLLIVSAVIVLIGIQLWRRRRI